MPTVERRGIRWLVIVVHRPPVALRITSPMYATSGVTRSGTCRLARERFARFVQLYPESPRLAQFREALAAP
jgi:hypothetical protein